MTYLIHTEQTSVKFTKKVADMAESGIKERGLESFKNSLSEKIRTEFKAKDANFNAALYQFNPEVIVELFKQNPLFDLFGVRSIDKGYKFSQFRSVAPSGWANMYGDVEQAPLLALRQNVVTSGKIGLHISYDHKISETHTDLLVGGDMKMIKQKSAMSVLKNAINKINLFGVEGYGVTGSNVNGLLTSPYLAPIFPAVNPGSGADWASKTGLQIANDILSAINRIKARNNLLSGNDSQARMKFVVMLPAEQISRVMDDMVFANGGQNDVSIAQYIQNKYPLVSFVQIDELKSVPFVAGNPDLMLVMLANVNDFDDVSTGIKDTVDFKMSYMFEDMPVQFLHNSGVECHRMVADTFGAIIYRPGLIERVSGI